MIANILFGVLYFIGALLVFLFVLFKYTEYKASRLITDVVTKEPLKNRTGAWEIMKMMLFQKKDLFDITTVLGQKFNFENYSTYFTPWMPALVISNAEDAKRVLMGWKEFPKISVDMFDPISYKFLGDNVVFVNHDQWKTQRSIMNPAFHNIDRFSGLFVQETFKCLNGMEMYRKSSNCEAFEIPAAEFTTSLTLDVLGLAVFGYGFELLSTVAAKATGTEYLCKTDSSGYVDAYKHVMESVSDVKLWLAGDILSKLPLESINKIYASIDKMDQLVFSLINHAKLKKENATIDRHISDDTIDRPTVLDLMLGSTEEETGRQMTDKELRDNIIIFFLAGHETTAAVLASTMFCLAKNKNAQEKLIQEIDQVLGTDVDKEINVDLLKNMDYLDWVVKEGLRKHPPVALIPERVLHKQSETIGGIKIKKGALISINAYNIHHNPKYWKDPHEFRPERFSPEESKGRPSTSWIPFGGGARLCIGNLFSLLEQKIFLSLLLQRYTLEIPEGISEYQYQSYTTVIVPDSKMKIVLKPRQHS